MTGADAATNYTFDTGSGVVFTISGTNGNMTSLKHNGVELAASGKAAGQFESGWSSATVTAKTFDSGNSQLISAKHDTVTQYYFARKGDNNIYLDTAITGAIDPGEARFIARVKQSLVPTSPVAARTGDSTATVEGSDVFAFANGQTASKFYSSQRLIAQQPFGAHGTAHGVYIIPGTHEMSSGGPFFRDIEVNDTGTVTNITHYMYSGHTQTEPMRLGLQAPYALAVTGGGTPAAVNLDFLSAYIPGLLSAAERGTVTGTATGSWGGLSGTVALAGPTGQYWATVSAGTFGIDKVRPGTYTATLYAGELAVGDTRSVTVTAGGTSTLALSGSTPAQGTLFQIGAFDGTPKGFLNADRIETMHPSDIRMPSWGVTSFTAGSDVSGFPMALFKSVNSPLTVKFDLASVPTAGAELRIATTLAFAGGRPSVTIGGWSSPASASPAPKDLDSRGVTRGTWRGINTTYTFTIPASALKTGSNSLAISTISGSSGTTFLSPNWVFDALALTPA
ncbi:MAG TPA: rhamnogalacturonan lyase B N-terminal domain-containing protein [Kineosporiaceae bacterium]|nr:rhamnogalacturonan lyase B N-terminal domain-containing protein [Kineosporiaceae bacterium]